MDDWPLLMKSNRKQRTIAQPAKVEGFGYWSGRDVTVEFRPAPADTGIVFVRHDLADCPRIPAHVRHRVEIPRRTTLRVQEAGVEMVEHVMAALAGLRIDNCEIWVDQPEMPGCDGSSQAFVEALDAAGIVVQDAPRRQLVIRRVLRVGNKDSWVEARPILGDQCSLKYHLDYGPDSPIGRQTFCYTATPQAFRRELAASRTFILKQEADWLLSQGLGRRTTCRDLLIFAEQGPLENPLRFPDECVRHKVLDMVGDLALAGCDFVGQLVGYRSGHRLSAELVVTLLAELEQAERWRQCA